MQVLVSNEAALAMRRKDQKMAQLQLANVQYSLQIGIIPCEVPKLYFYGEEFARDYNAARARAHVKPTRRAGGKYPKSYWGLCSNWHRGILVNIRGGNRNLRELEHTLVHELVHYRFRYMSHGVKFNLRVKEILRGRQFERKHITMPAGPEFWR